MRLPKQATASRAATRPPGRPSSAFSLLETLAVIAVIAILAALLVSVGSRALGAANASKCLANLRQMHTALAAYMQENDGRLPHSPNLFVTSLWPYAYPDQPRPTISGNFLPPGLHNTIFECPSARRDGSIRSYAFNMYLGDGKADEPKKAVSLNVPLSRIGLIADCSTTSVLTPSRITERHNGRCNVLYADGHVEPTRITEEIRRDYRENFWGRYAP